MTETTEGTLLDGKLRYRQFLTGHRSGFEPVLLAAAVPARPGDRVLEAGTGAGAALLCLATRVQDIFGIGLEIDFELAGLAVKNFNINGLRTVFSVLSDAATPPFGAVFDQIMANPPWHEPASTVSPDAKRSLAHRAPPGLLSAWINALAHVLKARGRLTFIISAAALEEAVAALKEAKCGGITIFPLWPRAGLPAGQIILSARRGNGPSRVLPGLILHDAAGISSEAEAVLRGGAPIIL